MYVSPKRCPKCRYERQPADTAPEWQCPSCGIAYSKAEGGLPAAAASVRTHAPEVLDSGGSAGKWIVTGLAVLAIVLFAGRAWRGDEVAPVVPAVAAADAEQPQVVMYATSWCPYCRQAREFFALHKIAYVERDVERDQIAAREHRSLGGGGVPTIVVGDTVVRGFSRERLTELLGPWMD